MKIFRFLFACIIASWGLSACSDTEPNIKDSTESSENANTGPVIIDSSVAEDRLEFSSRAEKFIDYEAAFALEMIKYNLNSSQESVGISPLGLYQLLSMVANADDATVRSEVMRILSQGNNTDIDALNEYNRKMVNVLPYIDDKSIFKNANALIKVPGLKAQQSYLNDLTNNFSTDFFEADLSTLDGIAIANNWCDEHTNGLIPEFFKQPIPEFISALLNANYFKAPWAIEFSEMDGVMLFHNIDGSESKVPALIPYTDKFLNFNSDGFCGVILPIGSGNYSFVAITPADDTPIKDLSSRLSLELVNKLISSAKAEAIDLNLPAFEIEQTMNLNNMLKGLGFSDLFTTPLNRFLCPTTGINAIFNLYMQSIKFNVSHNGIEAASVSAGILAGGADFTIPVVSFDKPFIYLLRENSTGTILYAGQVMSLPELDPASICK